MLGDGAYDACEDGALQLYDGLAAILSQPRGAETLLGPKQEEARSPQASSSHSSSTAGLEDGLAGMAERLPSDWASMLASALPEWDAVPELDLDDASFSQVLASLEPIDSRGVVPSLGGNPPAFELEGSETKEAASQSLSASHEAASAWTLGTRSPAPATSKRGWEAANKEEGEEEEEEGSAEVDPQSKKSKADLEEERHQRRLAKNRRTAHESRERKKAAMKDLGQECEALKNENLRLKQELEAQKNLTQLLREELASFTRSAMPTGGDTAAAAGTPTEPAALTLSTNTLLPVPKSTELPRTVSLPPNSQLVTAWSILACLYLASQTAGSVLGALSTLSAHEPEAAAKLISALTSLNAGSSNGQLPVALPQSALRLLAQRCSGTAPTGTAEPWQAALPSIREIPTA